MSRYLSLSLFLALVVGAAAVGTSFEAGLWYFDMQKPSWTPPAWVFGPAWGLLYLLMAAAGLLALAAHPAATAECAAEDGLEDVADIGKVALPTATATTEAASARHSLREGFVAETVIGGAFLRVLEAFIRLVAGLELGLRLGVTRIAVGVPFHRELAVRALERRPVRVARHAERFVIVD